MVLQHLVPAKSNSFKHQYTIRYPSFRTPSPPTDAIEIFSPQQWSLRDLDSSDRVGSKKRRVHDNGHALTDSSAVNQDSRPLSRRRDSVHKRHYSSSSARYNDSRRIHDQTSPSPLYVFATVATSPSIGASAPRESHQQSSWTVHSRHASESAIGGESGSREHTAKGALSLPKERGHATEGLRPATSHFPISSRASTYPIKTLERTFTTSNSTSSPTGLGITNVMPGSSLEDAKLLLTLWEGSSNRTNATLNQDLPTSTQNASVNGNLYKHPTSTANAPQSPLSLEQKSIMSSRHINGAPNSHEISSSYSTIQTGAHAGVSSASSQQLVDQDVARDEALTTNALEKPKSRGWPKGKPRGPRNTSTASKKPTPKGRPKKSVDRSLHCTPQLSQDFGFDELHQTHHPNEGSHQHSSHRIVSTQKKRRYSGTDLEDAIPRTIWAGNISKRANSAGPVIQSISMPTKRPIPQPQPRQRKSRVTTCAFCGSERNPMNGYQDFWINCNGCKSWFHHVCVGFKSEREVNNVDKFYCETCEPNHGTTTYVRKSGRAHTAVDYAGLNEGKIRSAHDVPHHHYIEPIKEGRIQLQPETFPRMRPELVTAEFFQKSGTMREPVVIPAVWNPRPSQLLYEGDELEHFDIDYEYDCVPDEGQDKLDMVIPEGLTVRRVSELYGPEEKLEVIDVKSQEGGDKRWNMTQWANYYEAEGEKPVRNVISLEVSASKLGKLIRRPKVVRDLDLQDAVWPEEEAAKGIFPRVQFYCLMSVADCYTDFHIDFGGSSVYYHILKGKKVFFFIPPRKQHLKKYEEWCLSSNQGSIFLGDETKECYRVDLAEGDTMLIPSGWIHAVWTPENSLVIGGNFLTRMHYGMQIQINEIEKNTGVARKFRYPHFQKIQWHAILDYLTSDPLPYEVAKLLWSGDTFERKQPVYYEFDQDAKHQAGSEQYNARHYSEGEIDGIQDLIRYCFRTVMISLGKVGGISKTTQEAVIRSLPKGYGDHFELIQTFALWAAWKRGNEQIPLWAYPNAILEDVESNAIDKKPTIPGAKRKGRPPKDPSKLAPERRSSRQLPKDQSAVTENAESKESVQETLVIETKIEGDFLSTEEKKSSDVPKSTLNPFKRFGISPLTSNNNHQIDTASRVVENEYLTSCDINIPENSREPTNDDDFTLEKEEYRPTTPQETSSNIQQPPLEDIATADAVMTTTTVKAASEPSSGSKRPRTKACEDCKKSKRRCIHDENGRVDPLKAQESPVRRGPQNPKRPRNNSDAGADGSKRIRRASNSSLRQLAETDSTQSPSKEPQETQVMRPSSAEQTVQSFVRSGFEGQPNHLPTPQSNDDSAQTMTDASRSAGPSPPQGPTDVVVREGLPTEQFLSSTEQIVGVPNNGSSAVANITNTSSPTITSGLTLTSEPLLANGILKEELPPLTECKSGSFKRIADRDVQSPPSRALPPLQINADMRSSIYIKTDDDGLVSPPLSPPISPFTDAAPSSPALDDNDKAQIAKSKSTLLAPEHELNGHDQDRRFTETDVGSLKPSSMGRSVLKSRRNSEISRTPASNVSKKMETMLVHIDSGEHIFEDKDMEFARSLAEQDFGLRRRKQIHE